MTAARPRSGTLTRATGRLCRAAFLALSAALPAAAPAAAQYYGAIGYSPETGAMGWGVDFPTLEAARKSAMSKCAEYAKDCKLAIEFRDGCGVIAEGEIVTLTIAIAAQSPSRSEAERVALRRCGLRASDCKVQRWVCTTGSMF